MKVFLRSTGDINPYLKLLISALEQANIEVLIMSSERFFLWRSTLKHGLPDIVHLQWHHNLFTGSTIFQTAMRTIMFYLQWFTLRIIGVRFVWTVHNIVNHEKHQAGWELLMCRALAHVVDGIIVHCHTARSTVARAYRANPEKISVVPHGHYADWYPPMLDKNEARRRLGLPTNRALFLYFGLIREYKGLDKLLDAFAANKESDVQLILLGKPNSRALGNSLAAQAATDPRVQIRLEFIPDDQLMTYLSACDLVVLPYQDFLTSGAAVLAASCGRPILTPKWGCMQTFPPAMMISYEPETTNGLQNALTQAQRAPLEKMGAAAKAYIKQFPWPLVATETINVYQAVSGLSKTSRTPAPKLEV